MASGKEYKIVVPPGEVETRKGEDAIYQIISNLAEIGIVGENQAVLENLIKANPGEFVAHVLNLLHRDAIFNVFRTKKYGGVKFDLFNTYDPDDPDRDAEFRINADLPLTKQGLTLLLEGFSRKAMAKLIDPESELDVEKILALGWTFTEIEYEDDLSASTRPTMLE
ncbi:MAG: hypothetical protein COU69_01975 [Candidatus Pacebacteria bacterium CG10_big_fil_rev_8_21_14_0_10_56_10]|nr:MAG: hypothetical protein COU69_01975 [Candidatus Pacebacteria bacterium CG10_big_fil_rev_8_21_14_0_10_56_10]